MDVSSFIAEDVALHDPVNNIAGSVARASGSVENFLYLFPIRKADGGSRAIRGELADQVSRHRSLFVIQQEPFEFANVFERPSIRQGAAGIDRQPEVESERLTRKTDAGFRFHILGICAIAVAPAAHHIEAFEREPRRVDRTVAGCAGCIGPMTIKLLANGDGTPDIGFESRHASGLSDVDAEDPFDDPDAA